MRKEVLAFVTALTIVPSIHADAIRLDSPVLAVSVDEGTGRWSLLDKRSGAQWPSQGSAGPGTVAWLDGGFQKAEALDKDSVRLRWSTGTTLVFSLTAGGDALEIRYEGTEDRTVRVLEDALAVTDVEGGYAIVPCREGLLIPADSGKTFKQVFGASEYEGCHMNMLGFVKSGSALIVAWDSAYVFAEVQSNMPTGESIRQRLSAGFDLRRGPCTLRLIPLGKGDSNTIASAYRRYAQTKGLAVTLKDKIRRQPHVELMIGAANAKLWTCLNRRMNEESTKEESVTVQWTFDEAAQIAEHLRKDVGIERCLFIIGGWTEGGYDCRHPDNLPANPECGGNDKLADAIRRIQSLGYVASLHDNYQDMYRDAKSWDPAIIEKRADGSLITGGQWLGGRAYMVCAPNQLKMAMRPQNLPDTRRLFKPWSYFIDTTYAVGPRECFDPQHRIDRNDDIACKIKLSDYAREVFGIFGSECGREWALPHSDFFEGLTGVSGRYYHNLKPQDFGATVIPFFEMVYHDCQVCYGKYGYRADQAAEYVAHHVLCARPLHYHSFPNHLYWKDSSSRDAEEEAAAPQTPDRSCYTRSDNGWAQGMHPLDIFLKNTQEVLGPLNRETAFSVLNQLEFLTPDRSVRKAIYGSGPDATQVVVNFGSSQAEVVSIYGGEAVLPPWGFLIEGPRFTAFYASRWNELDYEEGSLFTLQSIGDEPLTRAGRIRIFHAFGRADIRWNNNVYTVEREQVIQPMGM